MKSKKAEELINTLCWRDPHDKEQLNKAVELAEEDARERAVRALQMACPFYDDGRNHCYKGDTSKTCDKACMKEFLKHYDNEQ